VEFPHVALILCPHEFVSFTSDGLDTKGLLVWVGCVIRFTEAWSRVPTGPRMCRTPVKSHQTPNDSATRYHKHYQRVQREFYKPSFSFCCKPYLTQHLMAVFFLVTIVIHRSRSPPHPSCRSYANDVSNNSYKCNRIIKRIHTCYIHARLEYNPNI
jgi:hypothetical protein